MCGSPQPTEWDRLITKLGLLTLSAGLLEAAVMAMHCKATNQSEAKLKSRLNKPQREGLKKVVRSLDWSEAEKADLAQRLSEIEALNKRRNAFIHLAAGVVSNNSISGIPAGKVINLRTWGLGATATELASDYKRVSFKIGTVASKIDLSEIDQLINDLDHTRVGLEPYMDLVDKITHPARSPWELLDKLQRGECIS